MTTSWYHISSRLLGLLACVVVVVLGAQWLALSFGWEPIIGERVASEWSERVSRPLREGPAMLVAVAAAAAGAVLLVGWVLAGRRGRPERSYRLGRRSRRLRIDRSTLAASLERRLDPLDRRVDVHLDVDRGGGLHLRLVTPDTSATGTVAEHSQRLKDVLDERGLTNRVKSLDVLDVRKLKSRHRVR